MLTVNQQDLLAKLKLNCQGYIKNRESQSLEYKQNFQLGDNLLKYIKTLVGMANNEGGYIIFGVQNTPHIPIGMTNGRFSTIDPKEIDEKIRNHFSPELKWDMGTFILGGKELGFIHVAEAQSKPIVCKSGKQDILREGAIYYRYRAESKEIEYPELRQLLDSEKEKERLLWIQHIQKIAYAGPQNIHLLNSFKGELTVGDGKILIDKSILDQIAFIKEGHFVENNEDGTPTLKLLGNIEGITDTEVALLPDDLYPYTTKQLMEKLNVNQYEMQAILHHYKVKERPKYHAEISHGKMPIHKYSECFFTSIQKLLEDPRCLPKCLEDYKEYQKVQAQQHRSSRRRRRI